MSYFQEQLARLEQNQLGMYLYEQSQALKNFRKYLET